MGLIILKFGKPGVIVTLAIYNNPTSFFHEVYNYNVIVKCTMGKGHYAIHTN